MIRSGTLGKFSAGQPYSKLPNFHFEGREGRSQAGPNSYSALTQGRSDLRLETQKMKTFKKLFLSKEALDQKSEKNGPVTMMVMIVMTMMSMTLMMMMTMSQWKGRMLSIFTVCRPNIGELLVSALWSFKMSVIIMMMMIIIIIIDIIIGGKS